MTVLDEYFKALDRLKKNTPVRVEKNSKITNDSVALEAGRKKGSIKKSRSAFYELIVAIEKAQREQVSKIDGKQSKINSLKKEVDRYKKLYEEGLAREIMLVKKLYELETEFDLT